MYGQLPARHRPLPVRTETEAAASKAAASEAAAEQATAEQATAEAATGAVKALLQTVRLLGVPRRPEVFVRASQGEQSVHEEVSGQLCLG